MSMSATSPATTTLNDDECLFRTCASDAYQSVVAAALAEREGFSRVFVINRDDPYGNGLREAFAEAFADDSHFVEYSVYSESDADYADTTIADAMASFAASGGPEAIFLIAFVDDGAAILKKAIGENLDVKWMFPDGPKADDLLVKVGNNAYLEGCIGTSPAAPIGAEYVLFRDAFKAEFSRDPEIFTSNVYDAIYLIAVAMELSLDPDSGEEIRDNLSKTHAGNPVQPGQWDIFLTEAISGQADYAGASGPVDFDQNGDVLSNFEEWSIESGEIVTKNCWTSEVTPCE